METCIYCGKKLDGLNKSMFGTEKDEIYIVCPDCFSTILSYRPKVNEETIIKKCNYCGKELDGINELIYRNKKNKILCEDCFIDWLINNQKKFNNMQKRNRTKINKLFNKIDKMYNI